MSAGVIAAHYVEAGGGGAVAFVDSTTATATNVINKPAVVVGDLMLWFVSTSSTTWTVAGWTNLITQPVVVGASNMRAHVLYRIVDGSEGSTFTGPSLSAAHAIVAYRNAAAPRVFAGTTQPSGASLSTGLTTTVDQPEAGMVVHGFHAGRTGGVTLTTPSGGTERANLTANTLWALSVTDENAAGSGAVTRTSTASATSLWAAISVYVPSSSVAALPYVVEGTTATGNSAAPAIAAPASLAVGDLIFITAGIISTPTITAVPAGFTAIDTVTTSSGGGQTLKGVIYYKVATSGDLGATFTFTASAAQVWFCSATVIRGQNASPFLVAPSAGTTSSGTTVSAPSRTATGGVALAVSFFLAGANSTTFTALTSGTWPFTISAGGFGGVLVTTYPVHSGGVTQSSGATRSASASWLSNTVLVKP